MHRSRITAAAALCTLTACTLADTFTVYVFNREYSQNNPSVGGTLPDDPTIHVGDTVHWVVSAGFHTVTSVANTAESFDSGFVQPGNTFDHTFTNVGVFAYYCSFHGFDNGNGTASGMAGLVTVEASTPACPADLGVQGGEPGHDGALDNNDFVVFINYFFDHNPAADVGIQGGVPGSDTAWDNNDFVVYINLFFNGCAG